MAMSVEKLHIGQKVEVKNEADEWQYGEITKKGKTLCAVKLEGTNMTIWAAMRDVCEILKAERPRFEGGKIKGQEQKQAAVKPILQPTPKFLPTARPKPVTLSQRCIRSLIDEMNQQETEAAKRLYGKHHK